MSTPTPTTSYERSQANQLVARRNSNRATYLGCRTAPHETYDQLEANLLNARSSFAKFLGDAAAPEAISKISAQQERSSALPMRFGEMLVPNAVFARDLTAGTFAAAGALIDPVPTGREWIHELLPYSAAVNAGVTFLPLPKALPFHLPRIQQSNVVSWASAETSPSTAQTITPTFDNVQVNWFQGVSELRFSKELVQLAPVSEGVEAELINHINRTKAAAIDNVFFQGNGTTQPLGLINTPTGSGLVNSTTISATTPTWNSITNAIAIPENLNAFSHGSDAAFVVSPNTKKLWSQTAKFATQNTGLTLYETDSNTVAGKRALTTSDATDTRAFYSSRWSDSYVLLSNATAFLVDPFTLAASAQVRIVMRFLVAVVHKRPEWLVVATIS